MQITATRPIEIIEVNATMLGLWLAEKITDEAYMVHCAGRLATAFGHEED